VSFPCMKCGCDSNVLDTRTTETPDGSQVRRRRICSRRKCRQRWTTVEVIAVKVGNNKFLSAGGEKQALRINTEVAKKLRAIAYLAGAGKL